MKGNKVHILEENQRELAADALEDAARRELAAGVLKQAGRDLQRFHSATSKIERELYLDAYRWIMLDDCVSPFSFLNVCRVLNLASDDVREEVMGDPSSGAFSYWTRRCRRAARRFQISVGELFARERNAVGAYSYENVN